MTNKNLLLELGTEELPPKSLRTLAQSLHDSFVKLLGENSLSFSSSKFVLKDFKSFVSVLL